MTSKLKINKDGTFHLTAPTNLSYTYFPMCNTHAMKSSITPTLSGDAKLDQNSFILPPITIEDLENSLLRRNVFFRINDDFTWSISGQTPKQILTPDKVDLYGDFLTHTIIRENTLFKCTIESFVPSYNHDQELHKVTITNTNSNPLKLKPVIGVPIYGRSADNIRDHRHVTALLNRVKITENGLINHPTFSFDERGHILNKRYYGVFTNSSKNLKINYFYPTLESFQGEGYNLLDPLVVKEDVPSSHKPGDIVSGYEAIGGMVYEPVVLNTNESISFVVSLAISDDEQELINHAATIDVDTFDTLQNETKRYWKKELSSLNFHFTDDTFNGWLKWVTLQPILRRIYGNSFMPHHDYGRGGKGWRDLWQDLLALILMNPSPVKEMILNNFKGVRIDGSNATIIGDKPGVFLADRNNIPRIWMDHGSWPLLTTKLYLDQSGDSSLLFENVSYFQDQFTHYTKQANATFSLNDPTLKTRESKTYYGTVLEHILVQNIVPFYNIGKHNNIRLEDADWNDGLDMANKAGESVAFTAFYGQNLITIADLLSKLFEQGTQEVTLFEEIDILLSATSTDKTTLLKRYFDTVKNGVSGIQKSYNTNDLANTLRYKGNVLLEQVRENEWLEDGSDGWFNGYYDNDSNRLDNIKKKDMTLTGQVFAIMSHAATEAQTKKTIASADKYLYKAEVGGYRLNTDFKEVKTNMGRLFGFAYGHKENGAMFSHMAMMYANALYKRGFVKAGHKVINSIYKHSINTKASKMYPGIPEYFDQNGRGMYSYLTGSASWMILTMVTEVFGVKGDLGYTILEPKLLLEQFEGSECIKLETIIGNKKVMVTYHNPAQLEFGDYIIDSVLVDGQQEAFERTTHGIKLNKKVNGSKIDVLLKQA